MNKYIIELKWMFTALALAISLVVICREILVITNNDSFGQIEAFVVAAVGIYYVFWCEDKAFDLMRNRNKEVKRGA